MKIRQDFVTNSSSSSFILAFNNKDKAIQEIASLAYEYPDAIGYLLRDIQDTKPLTTDELNEILFNEADEYAYIQMCIGSGCWCSEDKPTFQNLFLKKHPECSLSDMYKHPEYLAERKRIVEEYVAKIKNKIGKNSYIVKLDYSDNDGEIFSELEHEIMPNAPGVVAEFSHH